MSKPKRLLKLGEGEIKEYFGYWDIKVKPPTGKKLLKFLEGRHIELFARLKEKK